MDCVQTPSCDALSQACVQVFEVMKPASAVKVITWTCVLATDRDPQSFLSKSTFNLFHHTSKKIKCCQGAAHP